ncbi:MAG: hypothetical protein ABI034_09110, partial [Nakamurella sp.]
MTAWAYWAPGRTASAGPRVPTPHAAGRCAAAFLGAGRLVVQLSRADTPRAAATPCTAADAQRQAALRHPALDDDHPAARRHQAAHRHPALDDDRPAPIASGHVRGVAQAPRPVRHLVSGDV